MTKSLVICSQATAYMTRLQIFWTGSMRTRLLPATSLASSKFVVHRTIRTRWINVVRTRSRFIKPLPWCLTTIFQAKILCRTYFKLAFPLNERPLCSSSHAKIRNSFCVVNSTSLPKISLTIFMWHFSSRSMRRTAIWRCRNSIISQKSLRTL